MKTLLTHQNFLDIINRVGSGMSIIYIPSYTRGIIINKTCLDKWTKAGREVLKLDPDGRGFRLARGKHYDYVFAGGLVEIS